MVTCNKTCNGEANTICGGNNLKSISLYNSNSSDSSRYGSMIGCAVFDTSSPPPEDVKISLITKDKCVMYCSNNGSAYSGISVER